MARRIIPRMNRKEMDQPSEEELHYKSLTNAFKWLVSIGALFLAFIVGLGTFLTYSSFKDLRAEIKDSKDEAKGELREIRLEAERTAQSVRNRMDGTVTELTSNINHTMDEALGQISGFKDLAINQAKAKVEDVFEKRNLEGYVEEVAKTRLEGKMTDIADRTLTQYEKGKIDRVISDLNSNDSYVLDRAYNILYANINTEFDNDQIEALLAYVEQRKPAPWMGEQVLSILAAKRSPKIARFFEKSLKDSTSIGYGSALWNLGAINPSSDIRLFEQYFVDKINKRTALGELINNNLTNPSMLLKILNSRIIVDTVYRTYGPATYSEMKGNTRKSTAFALSFSDFEHTYFNTKK